MKPAITMVQNWLADITKVRVIKDRLRHPGNANVETLNLPGYYQTQAFTCGFTAGLMILHYFRPGFPAEQFFAALRPDERWGTSRRRLMDGLRLRGLVVSWRRDLDFKAVVAALDSRRPIAIVVKTAKPDVKHWVVIYGYRRRPNTVFVAGNGLLGSKEIPWGFFRQEFWAEPGSGLVCAGPRWV